MAQKVNASNIHGLLYAGLIVAGSMVTALDVQLAAGKIPLPAEWNWVGPVVNAGLIAVSMLLPKMTGNGQLVNPVVDVTLKEGATNQPAVQVNVPPAEPAK